MNDHELIGGRSSSVSKHVSFSLNNLRDIIQTKLFFRAGEAGKSSTETGRATDITMTDIHSQRTSSERGNTNPLHT